MKRLLDAGADPNQRVSRKVWYTNYNFDQSGVDEAGATPFWRAAYGADVDAMKLLVSYGADPAIPTIKPPERPEIGDVGAVSQGRLRPAADSRRRARVPPLLAAAGVGYGEGFAGNSHRHAPGGMLAAVRYLVEELGADVNARDHEGSTAVHHAASRGDTEMIRYLVGKGADVKAVNREGQTTIDLANGPVQRVQPWPETIKYLESLGAKNNHRCPVVLVEAAATS
jgi:ankyrin repeat protein